MFDLFTELKEYVGFGAEDEAMLRSLHDLLSPHFEQIAETFYARVLQHSDARGALVRGEKQVGQLKITLQRWMRELFSGPWDEAYVTRRARIGRVHVQIRLAQHYMVAAMNVVRFELISRLEGLELADRTAARRAITRILDIDLALMLHTYREDLESSQARAERLATFGQLVGSIGHELRNPLGVIETSLYVLKGRASDDEKTVRHLNRISQQVQLANEIVTQLLDLIRDKPVARVAVDLTHLVQGFMAEQKGPFTLALEPDVEVEGDVTQLGQVLSNLVQNAVHFAGEAGRVVVSVRVDGQRALLTVDDSGPGIDPAVRNRLFEPLVTSRPGGIGLGLALVKRIVERHGGHVEASRSPLGGARFEVALPGRRRS